MGGTNVICRPLAAAVLVLAACAGSDAGQPPVDAPDPVGALPAPPADSAWAPGAATAASRVLTVDGGFITLPRAFTIEVEPATLNDTQTVSLALAVSASAGDFASAARDIAGTPAWIGTVSFPRTCPPRPVHVTAALPATAGTRIATLLRIDGSFTLADTSSVVGATLKFDIPERVFRRRAGADTPCEATFAFAPGR